MLEMLPILDAELRRHLPTFVSPNAENQILVIGYNPPLTRYLTDTFCVEHPTSSIKTVMRDQSDDFFAFNSKRFTFIYVASHIDPLQVQRDAFHAQKFLQPSGILWFDQYRANRPILDAWTQVMGTKVRMIHRGYQLGLMKLAN